MFTLCWPHPVGEVDSGCGSRKESVLGMNNGEEGTVGGWRGWVEFIKENTPWLSC